MAKSKKKALTRLQLEKILLTPCKTEQDLKNFIKYFLKLELPDCKVSRYSDTDPFHAVWEVYDICVNKNNPQKIKELLYVAGRGSGKSLGMAIAELTILLHDQRDVVHVGAIMNQAKRVYAYQQKFLLNDRIKPIVMPSDIPEDQRILEKANMEKSTFNINGEKPTIEVLPCTLKACLTSESLIKDIEGHIRQLKTLQTGDKIQDLNGFVEILDNKLELQECLRVVLDDGRIIEGTKDHKILTQRGWIELQLLNDDDYVFNSHEAKRYLSGECIRCGQDRNKYKQKTHKTLCSGCYRKQQRINTKLKTSKQCIQCNTISSSKWYTGPICRSCYRLNHYKTNKLHNSDWYIQERIANNIRSRMSKIVAGSVRVGSAVKDLGCSIEEFKSYLESKFLPGMSWNNYDNKIWHIDHIKPLSAFDLTDSEEFKVACHYTNLQPLWAEDNLKKGDKWQK